MNQKHNYLIYACEQRFQGYHGIYDYCVEYDIIETVANEYGHDMSINLMESYSCIIEDLEAEVEECLERDTIDDNEWEMTVADAIAEAEEENTEWTLYRLRDDLTAEDKEKIKHLDWEQIRDNYCIKE